MDCTFTNSYNTCGLNLLYTNISSYSQFQVVTNIQINQERPILFPKITICLYSPITTSFSQNFLNEQVYPYLNESLPVAIQLQYGGIIANTLNKTEKQKLSYRIEVYVHL